MYTSILKIYCKWVKGIKRISESEHVSEGEIINQWDNLVAQREQTSILDSVKKLYEKICKKMNGIDGVPDTQKSKCWDIFNMVRFEMEIMQTGASKVCLTSDNINDKTKYYRLTLEDFGHPGLNIFDKQFEQCCFKRLKLKDSVVRNCCIKQSIIEEDSYLRKAKFENVDFTGTIFRDSNLEKAEFSYCKFDYVRFENCLINVEQILNNLPSESNLKLALLKSLYNNELQQGKNDSADKILELIKKEEICLYKNIVCGKTSYYKKMRDENKMKYIAKCINAILLKFFVGTGLSVLQCVFRILVWILIFAVIYFLMLGASTTNIVNVLMLSLNAILLGPLDMNDMTGISLVITPKIGVVMLIENIIGVSYTAILTSILCRKVMRQ